MSEVAATIETMKCYKCEDELDYDPVDYVHPLCNECQNEFDDWLQNEMMRFN